MSPDAITVLGRKGTDTPVKVCGLTRAEDAVLAASLGAWALGFIFAESPRRVSVQTVSSIASDLRERARSGAPALIGVFRGVEGGRVAQIAAQARLDGIQLHGEETPEEVASIRGLAEAAAGRPLLVLKALGVASGDDERSLAARAAAYRSVVDLILLDTCVGDGSGGTGVAFPWLLARETAQQGPTLVAGGLRPNSAREALRVSGAWGVDVSSGVERAPGIKDDTLLRRLFLELGRADREDGAP